MPGARDRRGSGSSTNRKCDVGRRGSGQIGGMVLPGGRDDLLEAGLDLLEVGQSVSGRGACGRSSLRGRCRFRVRLPAPGPSNSGISAMRAQGTVVPAGRTRSSSRSVAAGECRADGLHALPALELQTIGVKDVPTGHDYRPYRRGFKLT